MKCGELSGSRNKRGALCGAYARKGATTCLAHADEVTRAEMGFGGAQRGSGRPRLPSPTEVARKLIEENVAVVLRPHFRALGFDVVVDETTGELAIVALEGGGAKIYGESRDGVVRGSPFDDLGAQMAAADKLLDRIYGRPKQATEVTGAGGGPLEIDAVGIPTDEEFQRELAELLASAGAGEIPDDPEGDRP